MRNLFFLLLLTSVHVFAQQKEYPTIIKTVEKTYDLIQLTNGDLLPFVKKRESQVFYAQGKPVEKIDIGSNNRILGKEVYRNYGDSATVVYTYNKKELETTDSILFLNRQPFKRYQYSYKWKDTVVIITQYWKIDSLHKKMVIKEKGKEDRVQLINQIDSNRQETITLKPSGEVLKKDTAIKYYNSHQAMKKIIFNSSIGYQYNLFEYLYNEYNDWTAQMQFVNKDTIGDHIFCVVRDIQYSNSTVEPVSKKSFYGYWVMTDGMRYLHFYPNGEVSIRRSPMNNNERIRKWGFDERQQQLYIEFLEEDTPDTKGFLTEGNRLMINYDKEKQSFKMGDFTFEKRPTLKRERQK